MVALAKITLYLSRLTYDIYINIDLIELKIIGCKKNYSYHF